MTAEEIAVAKAHLAVLKRRIDAVRAARPHTLPSEKQLYILTFPELTGAGIETPVRESATIGSEAAFVVQKILVVGRGAARNVPAFFEVIDRSSGGRELFSSQRGMDQNMRFPTTHFANTLPDNDRAANYSFMPLHSEYLLPKRSTVEVVFRGAGVNNLLRVALAGYRVYA